MAMGIGTGSRAALLSALVLAAGCEGEPPARPEEAPLVRVLRVGAPGTEASVEYPGDIRPRFETPLSFRVAGKIAERRVVAGSRVREGDLLARLDAADLDLAVHVAQSQAATARADRDIALAELARYKDLRERNYISATEFERRAATLAAAEGRLQAAEGQLRQASNQARYAELRADSDGVILEAEAEAGQVVAAGQRVMRLARPGEKEVAVDVPETHQKAFRQASDFAVTVSAIPGARFRGRLREFSPAADPATRTYAARIAIVDPQPGIELGMSARVAIASQPGAGVELPLNAIRSRGDGRNVWVVGDKEHVRAVPVKLVAAGAQTVVVEAALQAGDRVVTAGAQFLREGQRVRVLRDELRR